MTLIYTVNNILSGVAGLKTGSLLVYTHLEPVSDGVLLLSPPVYRMGGICSPHPPNSILVELEFHKMSSEIILFSFHRIPNQVRIIVFTNQVSWKIVV